MKRIITAPTTYEDTLHAEGFRCIAGVDEAGRGPLAGPVVAAAVVFPPGMVIEGVYDSKKISPARRAVLAEKIKNVATVYGIGVVDAAVIDRINILAATMLAMREAVLAAQERLGVPIEYALIDGNRIPALDCPTQAIVKGDMFCHAIAAAGILAKVTRDEMMCELDHAHPQYGFAAHKGYGTRAHLEALEKYGPCEAHRLSYPPVP